MKVRSLTSNKSGNPVPNQFHLSSTYEERPGKLEVFQSYNSMICKVDWDNNTVAVYKDWNYSKTTSKYFNQFLCDVFGDMDGMTMKQQIKKGKDFEMLVNNGTRKMDVFFSDLY